MTIKDHGRMWRVAGPIIVSNVSIPLLGAVDTAVMGHLPDAKYLGGVAVGALVFTFIYWGFGFLRMGTGGLTAQALGSSDPDEVRACLARAAVIGIPVAFILIALQVPIAWVVFSIVEATPEVEELSAQYFYTRIWGAPATLLNFALLGWFIGVQNTRAVLWHQLSLNCINIILDVVFVLGLGWGVVGVASATVIAEICAVFVGLWLARPMLTKIGGNFVWRKVIDTSKLLRTVTLNIDIFVRTICLVSAFAYFTAKGATFGNVVLAANAVLLNFLTFSAYTLDGFAHAAEALGGEAIGAKDRAVFRLVVRVSALWGVITAIAFAFVYFFAGPLIVSLLTGISAVQETALNYISWVIVLPVVAVFPYILDGIFLGATKGRIIRNAMIFSIAIYVAACFLLVPLWGNHGLWAALTIFMGARGLSLGVRYRSLAASVGPVTRNRLSSGQEG